MKNSTVDQAFRLAHAFINTHACEENKTAHHASDHTFYLYNLIWAKIQFGYCTLRRAIKHRRLKCLSMHGDGEARPVHDLLRHPSIAVAALGSTSVL